jgi:hypothetical protein
MAGKYACGHHLLLAHGKTKALYDQKYRPQQVRPAVKYAATTTTIAPASKHNCQRNSNAKGSHAYMQSC